MFFSFCRVNWRPLQITTTHTPPDLFTRTSSSCTGIFHRPFHDHLSFTHFSIWVSCIIAQWGHNSGSPKPFNTMLLWCARDFKGIPWRQEALASQTNVRVIRVEFTNGSSNLRVVRAWLMQLFGNLVWLVNWLFLSLCFEDGPQELSVVLGFLGP